jgi:hypothetical protein
VFEGDVMESSKPLAAPLADGDFDSEAEVDGDESVSDGEGPRCEGCSEVGHDFADCPHRDSSEEDQNDNEDEENSQDY